MSTLDHEYDEIDRFYDKVDEFYEFLTYVDENFEKITETANYKIDNDYFKIDTVDGYYEVQVDSTGMFLNCLQYYFDAEVNYYISIRVDYEEIVDYVKSIVETTETIDENQLNFLEFCQTKNAWIESEKSIDSNPGH